VFTLLHDDVESAQVFLFEVHGGHGHVLVDHLRDQADVAGCVREQPFNET